MVTKQFFTDGSKSDRGVYYAVVKESTIFCKGALHPQTSIYNAEATAILKAVEEVNRLNSINTHQEKYAIMTDSRSVLEELGSVIRSKSQTSLMKIINMMHLNLILVWVPSHYGIMGNEMVDEAAGLVITSDPFNENILYRNDYKSVVKSFLQKEKEKWWQAFIQNKCQLLHRGIEYENAWKLGKKELMIINRLRAGHTYLTHSHKISHQPHPVCGSCFELLTIIKHLFSCNADPMKTYEHITGSRNWEADLFDSSKFKKIKEFLLKKDAYHLV